MFSYFMNWNLEVNEVKFVYGPKGTGVCSEGTPIMDETSCREACNALNLPQDRIHGNDVCYKRGYNGKCYQDGQQGGSGYLICNASYQISGKLRTGNKIKIPFYCKLIYIWKYITNYNLTIT